MFVDSLSFATSASAGRAARTALCASAWLALAVPSLAWNGFGPRTDFPIAPGQRPNSIEAVDIDGDSLLDLVTANFSSSNVTVMRNLGGGSFGALPPATAGFQPVSTSSGDIDGDGDMDVAVALFDLPGGVTLLLNNAGTLTPFVTLAAGNRPSDVILCDLDGVNGIDMAVSNFASGLCSGGGDVTVLLDSGAFGYTFAGTYHIGCNPWAITCGDFDADGRNDLAATNEGSSEVHVLLNAGAGVFASPVSYPVSVSPRDITTADLDGDGVLDLVVGTGTPVIDVLWGVGNGTFPAPSTFPAGSAATAVACGDLDCDGLLDIAVANDLSPASDGSVTILYNGGGQTFPTSATYAVDDDPRSVVIAELDGTSGLDIGTANTNISTVSVLENRGCTSMTGTPICFGDGTGTPCPCGNNSPVGAGQGCLNSLLVGGLLGATGLPSLSSDSVSLPVSNVPATTVLWIQGTVALNAGLGVVFGDGLRCVGGTVVRLGAHTATGGSSAYPQAGDPPVSVKGQITAPATRVYQTWYRNSSAFCTSATFNLTNALTIQWLP